MVVGLILRCVSALAQALKGVLNLRPVFGLREIFLFRFLFFSRTVYRDMTCDHGWTLVARFSNSDTLHWMKGSGL